VSPTAGELPPGRRPVAQARVRANPEVNIVQNPDIIRRLATGLGVRQAHITPALNEGLQAVVVLEDLSERETQKFRKRFMAGFDPGVQPSVPGVNPAAVMLVNPGLNPAISIGGAQQTPSTARLILYRVSISVDDGGTSPTQRLHLFAAKLSATGVLNNLPGPPAQVIDFTTGDGGQVGGGPNGTQGRLCRTNITPVMLPDQAAGVRTFDHAIVNSFVSHVWDFTNRPIIIDPDFGIGALSEELSLAELWCNFEWEEEPLKR
jgi:hypothetical protein